MGVRVEVLKESLRMSRVKFKYVKVDRTCKAISARGRTRRLVRGTVSRNYAFFSATRVCKAARSPRRGRGLLKRILEPCEGGVILTSGYKVHFSRATAAMGGPLVPSKQPRAVGTSVRKSLVELGASRLSLCCVRHVSVAMPVRRATKTVGRLVRRKGVAR